MIKKFDNFVNEKKFTEVEGILFLETDDVSEVDWSVIFNVTSYWDKYKSGSLSLENFNDKLTTFLKEQKTHMDDECYTEMCSVLGELKGCEIEKCETIYNKIYDLFDTNNIKLKIDEDNEE